MKLKTSEFAQKLKFLVSVARNYGYIAITSDTVSSAKDGIKAVLHLTDRSGSANVNCEDAEGFGGITVFSKPLYQAVAKVKTDTIDLNIQDGHLILKAGRSRFKLMSVNTYEMEVVTDVKDDAAIIDTKVESFERLIDRVWYAAAKEEGTIGARLSGVNISGVHIHTIDGKLVSVATDGHRLARYAIDIDTSKVAPPEIGPLSFTVPNNAVKVIKGFLDLKEGNADLKIKVGAGKMNVSTDYGEVTTTLIEQPYPDYKAIMPEAFGPMVELDCERLSKVLDTFKGVMPEDKAVRADFNGGEVTISARSENGTGEETLDYDGENDTEYCMFNAGYMMDALRQCECLIQFNKESPILFKGQIDSEYRVMVMPMRSHSSLNEVRSK